MSQSLFTTQTPASDNSDGTAPGITTSTTITFDTNGLVSGIRFWAPSVAAPGDFVCELWLVTSLDDGAPAGTRLASAVPGSVTPSAWNNCLFSAPVSVDNAHVYRVAVNNSARRYVSTGAFFASGPLVNGHITGIQNRAAPFAGLFDGTFADGQPPNTYPGSSFNSSCYFIDVLFDPAGTEQDLAVNLTATSGMSVALANEVHLAVNLTATAGLTVNPGPNDVFMPMALTATSGMNAPLNVPAGGPVDPISTPVANELLACFTALLQEMPSPPAKTELRVGAETGPLAGANVDECCAGLAWVRVANMYPSWNNFPGPDNDWVPCGPLGYAVVLEMGVAFCMPWSDSDDTFDNTDPPNTTDWQNAFTTSMQHQTLMRRAAACCWRPTQRRVVGEWKPLSVEGGCTGGTMLVTVSVLPPCADC